MQVALWQAVQEVRVTGWYRRLYGYLAGSARSTGYKQYKKY